MAVCAGLGLLPDLEDVEQDEQIEYPDDPQKDAGDAGTDDSPHTLQLREIPFHDGGCKSNGNRQTHDNRGMAQREEESYAKRLLTLLQHVPHSVIDRCDVICIEG